MLKRRHSQQGLAEPMKQCTRILTLSKACALCTVEAMLV